MAYVFASTGATLAARACKRAKVRKGGTVTPDAAGTALQQLAAVTGRPVHVEVRAGFDTACWAFDGSSHRIALGDRFHTAMTGKPPRVSAPSGMDQHAIRLAEQLFRHEAWHGRVTDRDLASIAQRCRDGRVPFALFNILEDARIEFRARLAEGGDFGWWRWFSNGGLATDPVKYLWQLVNREGRPTRSALPMADAAKVREFYDAACAAADSYAVVEVGRQWVEHFRGEAETITVPGHLPRVDGAVGEETDGSAPAGGDTADAPSVEGMGEREATTLRDGAGAPGELGAGAHVGTRTSTKRVPWMYYADAAGHPGFSTPLDRLAADRLAAKLAEVVAATASANTARVATSGSRLHLPGVISGAAQAFRTLGKTGGRAHLTWIIDMSGSMGHDWNEHGKTFVAAVLRLLRRRVITGSIWLTGDGRHALVPTDLRDDELDTLLPTKESESVAVTLEAIRPVVEASHATVIYTDAALTDGHVDAGLWRARGVDLLGACVIPASASEYRQAKLREEMVRHFGRAISGRTGLELATKLAQYSALHLTKRSAA